MKAATHSRKLFGAIVFLATLLSVASWTGSSHAAAGDVLAGAASSQSNFDVSLVNQATFADYFTYNGTTTPSLTIGGNVEAQIGAIFTGGTSGNWYQVRIVIDSDGDETLEPFDWSDTSHPWNRPDNGTPGDPSDDPVNWDYTYPNDYPDVGVRGDTITMTWNDADSIVTGFPWDTFQWWWYESSTDKTDSWWMEQGQLMNVWWSGRDQNWTMLANGNYKVQVWVDENGDGDFAGDEANKTMVIAVETASITGTVKDASGDAIMGARVEAGSYLAWGEARTTSDGTFTVSGLQAGGTYHVRVQASGKVTAEQEVALPSGQTTASTGIITMSDAISITGTVKLDRDADGNLDEAEDQFAAFTNMWGWEQNDLQVWIDAWNRQGPGWGNTNVQFQVGDSSAAFTINVPPPSGTTTYQVNVHVEGYATSPITVEVDSNGGVAGTIVLTKASILTGSVLLPSAITDWKPIDVQAVDVTNSDNRYWGWGNIDPSQHGGSANTGDFRIDGIPAGTYTLQLRVMGYAPNTVEDVVVVEGVDKAVGQIEISEGRKITGTLTIQGDTSTLQRWQGDNEDPLNLWVDAWSPSGGWSGTGLQVARGVNQSASYSLGGLSDAQYEVNCWIGDGFELVDESGNAPVFVTLNGGNSTKNLVLKAHEGIVRGTITGPGGLDLTKVVVEVKRPWDWMPPTIATVGNGLINASTGAYAVSGLGTGDYVVKAGMYDGYIDYEGNPHAIDGYSGDGWLMPNSAVGVSMQRVFVQNDADSPTTQNIALQTGYTISGTVDLSTTDAPWHDLDGDGVQDGAEVVTMNGDVAGQTVKAMPMEMMFMGGSDPRVGVIQADGSYEIKGLAPGVYIVMPPFSSPRIAQLDNSGPADGAKFFEGGQETHHWTTTTQTVVIADSDVSGKGFTLGNGHTLNGRLTLPEAQTSTEEWQEWQWVGQLELETATHQFLGHGKPVFRRDFNNGSRYDFTFYHVANGDYLVRFWTDRYVPGNAEVTVSNANASVNLTIEKGANLVGKLVDADTGEAVTSSDGVRVICEAFPRVEGGYRETFDDDWSQSYIESDSGLQSGSFGGEEGQRENRTPGKFHLNALPAGYKYVVIVRTMNGKKTGGAKNYVGQVKAGIEIPDGATGDIDVGTINLKEGTTIKGRLTDNAGNPIPGVDVCALPSDTHDGSTEADGVSDTEGFYTIYGISPDVSYYDLIAAEKPMLFDDWGKTVEWGEKRKYNVTPGTTDADFTLGQASASLSGTIIIPDASEFMLPFKGEGEAFPAAYILMQRKGVVYKDVLEGMEGMTMPMPGTAVETTYTIDHIEPGKYKVFFMNYGLPTQVYDNVTIEAGSNTLDATWSSVGYSISGTCALETGGYPSSADISGVVCMNSTDQSLIFGQLTQKADGTYSAYEVPGLADGATYQLAFYKETGFEDAAPDVIAAQSFTVNGADLTDQTATISRNTAPILIVQAVQDPGDANNINIGIFSTSYLTDDDISLVSTEPTVDSTAGELYISSGSGSLGTPTLSGDKRNIRVTYTKDAGDGDVSLVLAVHYGDDETTKLQTLTFNVNVVAKNGDVVTTYMAGQVKLGNGDASQIYVPAGAFNSSDGKINVTIEKTDEEPGAALFRASLGEEDNTDRGVFSIAASTALPTDVSAAGDQYDFSVAAANDGATVTQQGAVTVQIQYDADAVGDIEELDVWHLVGGAWTRETTNRTVDAENHTISVDVTSLSPFVAAVDDGTSSSTGGGSNSSCFIDTAAAERVDSTFKVVSTAVVGSLGATNWVLAIMASLGIAVFAKRGTDRD